MANYSTLKAAVNQYIKQNGNKDITGPVLNSVLTAMIDSLGANYTFAGIATPSTNPGTPDQNVFYLATKGGTYTNFNAAALPEGISLLMWNGSWTAQTIMYNDGGVFDISVYKSTGGTLATFADLSAALGTGGANIPEAARKGGMSIKFVSSSDNKYVQYRLMADDWSIDTDNWSFCGDDVLIENPEYIKAECDANGNLLFWIKVNGSIDWAIGVPTPVKAYVDSLVAEILNGNEGTDIDGLNKVIAFLDGFATSNTLDVLLNTKVDKVEGNSLIDADFASSQQVVDNPEWLRVNTDAEGKILEGIKSNGKKYESLPTNQDDILQKQINDVTKEQEKLESGYNSLYYDKYRNDIYHGKAASYLWGEYIKTTNPLQTITERSHVEPQALAAKAKVDAFIGNDTNCIVFPIITDVHDNGSRISIAEDIINSSKYIQYDFIPQLGDIGLEGTCYSSIARMERWAEMYAAAHQGVPPILSVKGNHDVLCDYFGDAGEYDRSGIFVDELAFSNYLLTPIMRRNNNIHWVYDKSYLYYDIPDKNVRILMLNSCEDNYTTNRWEFYYYYIDQIQWVIDTLNSTPNNYNVLVMGHRTPCRADLISSIPPNGTILAKIMEDYNAHVSGVNTQHGLSWDFTGKGNKVISQISGDCHVDAQGTVNGLNYIISQGQANWTLNGSKSDITFTENFDYRTVMFCDIVCIKPSEQKIKIIKMGWGDDSLDRVLNY